MTGNSKGTISPSGRVNVSLTSNMAHVWLFCLCLFHLTLAIVSNKSNDLLDVRVTVPDAQVFAGGGDKCVVQLHASLEKLRKRQESSRVASLIDLSGYALHQSLRNAPVDMYITDIKVRAPSVGSWVQVQNCQFSRQAEMSTHLLFNDLLVSGTVRLLPGDTPVGHIPHQPHEHCTMTLRLRRAGLDLKAAPDLNAAKIADRGKGIQVRTESSFVDPHFLSVHAYGCKLEKWAREGWLDVTSSRRFSRTDNTESPEIRIISLGQEPDLAETEDSEIHKNRILGYASNSEKLAAVLSVKNQFAQQANAVFQAHGPFSQFSTPAPLKRPIFTSHVDLPKPVSVITELDENLRPVRPDFQHPFITPTSSLPKLPLYGSAPSQPLQDVSTEMEDVFLRGAKALLSKYLEKQLEVPLKEALMTKIGFTVSYG